MQNIHHYCDKIKLSGKLIQCGEKIQPDFKKYHADKYNGHLLCLLLRYLNIMKIIVSMFYVFKCKLVTIF